MEPTKEEPITHHVLLVAFSAQGHINPMLRLATRLLSKGLHVTFATTEVAGHRMLKSSASLSAVRLRFFSDGLPLHYDRKANLDLYMTTFASSGPAHLSALLAADFPAASRRRLTCLITNPFVPWAADVAAAHGVPSALLWIQPSAIYSIYYRFYNRLSRFPTPESPNTTVDLPGLPPLRAGDLPSFVLPSNDAGSIPKLLSGMFSDMGKFRWVLGNTYEDLEHDVTSSMSDIPGVTPVGPLVPPSLFGHDESLDIGIDMWAHDGASQLAWLDRQEKSTVVYVSFGSITVLSKTQMESVATALKNSGSPFLWVVKPPEGPNPDGAGTLPENFPGEMIKNQGLIVPWCPQTKILAHPSILCFLTHCGWNSMLESIAAGVPVIGYPQWSDQPTNAKLMTDVFKIGVRINGTLTSENVLKCIDQMRGSMYREFKNNAEELQRAAREAVADGGSSDRNIQKFVDEIIGENCGEDEKLVGVVHGV